MPSPLVKALVSCSPKTICTSLAIQSSMLTIESSNKVCDAAGIKLHGLKLKLCQCGSCSLRNTGGFADPTRLIAIGVKWLVEHAGRDLAHITNLAEGRSLRQNPANFRFSFWRHEIATVLAGTNRHSFGFHGVQSMCIALAHIGIEGLFMFGVFQLRLRGQLWAA